MKRTLIRGVGLLVLLTCVVPVAACALQNKLIFFPGPAPTTTPSVVGLAFEDLRLATSDGCELGAWWIPCDAPRGAVLVCHGNAGSIADRLDIARFLHAHSMDVLLFDYRGYGTSTGSPNGPGVARDADAAFDWLRARLGAARVPILAWGESLGGAVAAELATRRPVDALVLESAFTSLGDVASEHYGWLPVRWILRTKLDTLDALARLELPLLVIHGRNDGIVPFAHGERLFGAGRGRKVFAVHEGGHNDSGWSRDSTAQRSVSDFLATL